MNEPSTPGAKAAGKKLASLLSDNPTYRRRWLQHVQRKRTAEISYAAVSMTLALHLWDQGLRSDTDTDLARQLRDRVRQALRGERIAHETLNWFIEAFSLSEPDASAVWDAFSGRSVHPLRGDGIAFTLRTPPVPLVTPQQLQTTALFTTYQVDSNRTLRRIDSSHIIVALEDGVDTFAYSPRDSVTDAVAVTGASFAGFHQSSPGFVGLEFRLEHPLRKGQQTSLQYYTLHQESDPCTDIRRAARKEMRNVDMRIVFEDVAPARAWWCAWDSYSGGTATLQVPAVLRGSRELHQFISCIEQTVVGFEWEWAA